MRSCLIATELARLESSPKRRSAKRTIRGCSSTSGALRSHTRRLRCWATISVYTGGWRGEHRRSRGHAEHLMPEGPRGMGPSERPGGAAVVSPQGRRSGTGSKRRAARWPVDCQSGGLGPGVQARPLGAARAVARRRPPPWAAGRGDRAAARIARGGRRGGAVGDIGGTEAVVPALRARAGGILDPSLVESYRARGSGPRRSLTGDPRERMLEVEPEPVMEKKLSELPDVALAFGDIADLKTPFTHGHSARVAKSREQGSGELTARPQSGEGFTSPPCFATSVGLGSPMRSGKRRAH